MRKVLFAILMAGTVAGGCKGDSKPKAAGGSGGTAAMGAGGTAAGGSAAAGSAAAAGSGGSAAPAGGIGATAGGIDQAAGSGAAGSGAAGSGAAVAKDDGVAEMGTGADGRSLYYPRALTAADLDGRTLRELALMRNTVYARAGHPFRKAWLRDYFTAKPWYHALDKDDASKISDLDRANVKLVAEREVAVPHDELVARRTALQASASPSESDQVELRLLNEQLGGTGGGAAAGHKASPLEDPSQLDRLLTLDELSDLSQRDLRILRNTVYARHGREFKSDTLIQWFSDKDWYHPNPDFKETELSSIDRKNVKLIRSVEDTLGGPMTEYQQKAEEGWFDGA